VGAFAIQGCAATCCAPCISSAVSAQSYVQECECLWKAAMPGAGTAGVAGPSMQQQAMADALGIRAAED
jgi:hypothetical protein